VATSYTSQELNLFLTAEKYRKRSNGNNRIGTVG